jgi:hypothetical protein
MRMVENGERPSRPEVIDFSPRIAFDGLWRIVGACWAQLPDMRPTGNKVQAAILNLPRGNAAHPVTNDGLLSATAEIRTNRRRKLAFQDCDNVSNSMPLLNDHIQVCYMGIRECLIAVVFDRN